MLIRDDSHRWKRVCDISSRLLDSSKSEWDGILDRECGSDDDLRAQVLKVCDNYSETDDFLGEPVVSPLTVEDSLVGRRIGVWNVLKVLGEGGMGRVYLVERADGVFHQLAALKVNHEHSNPASIQRFQAERRILAMVEHPSIARAIDGGTTASGSPYLVMEYVEDAKPIDEFRPESTIKERIRLFLQVVEAVEAAHRHQIAHRDLKPANILVTSTGLPKVLDFGIAKLFQDDLKPLLGDLTNAAHAALTPTYASPEQLLREPSSLISDIYSLGAVLYKMLTGRAPHDLTGLNILETVQLVTTTDPEPPSAHNKAVNAEADAVVLKALERSPMRRYGSATEFAEDLRRYLEGVPVRARQRTLTERVGRWIHKHRGITATASACLLLVLGTGTKILLNRHAETQRLQELRKSARSVLAEYQSQLNRLRGNTALLNRIATDEQQYLDSIASDAAKDADLRRVIASAYGSLAGNQSDKLAAQESWRKSLVLWRGVANPGHADRFETARASRRLGWSQINMGKLTEAGQSLDEGMRLVDSLSGTPSEEAAKPERVMLYFELSRLGAWSGSGPRAIENARKAVAAQEKLPSHPFDRKGIAITRMQLADAADSFGVGDPKLLAEALQQTRLAVQAVRETPVCPELSCREVKAAVLSRAPAILVHQGLLLDALSLREGLDLAEEILAEDPGNESARASLRFGLYYMGWALQRAGRPEECLRVRRRLLEISTVSAQNPGPAEDRLEEAIACGEVGRALVDLKRLGEAQGYFERQAEILAHPPNENVAWILRQTDVHRDLGLLHEQRGRLDAARGEFAKASAAAQAYLAKTGSTRARVVEADAHFQQGRTLLAADKAAGCILLRRSLDRYQELTQAFGRTDRDWEANIRDATRAIRACQ